MVHWLLIKIEFTFLLGNVSIAIALTRFRSLENVPKNLSNIHCKIRPVKLTAKAKSVTTHYINPPHLCSNLIEYRNKLKFGRDVHYDVVNHQKKVPKFPGPQPYFTGGVCDVISGFYENNRFIPLYGH